MLGRSAGSVGVVVPNTDADNFSHTARTLLSFFEEDHVATKVLSASSPLGIPELRGVSAIVVCDMLDSMEDLERVRLCAVNAALPFVCGLECGITAHAFVDGSLSSGGSLPMKEVRPEMDDVRHSVMIAYLSSDNDHSKYLRGLSDEVRVQQAQEVQLYWDMRDLHIVRLQQWLASRLRHSVSKLLSKKSGFAWHHYSLAQITGTEGDPFPLAKQRTLVPMDSAVWFKGDGWFLKGRRNLVIGSKKAATADIDLLKHPVSEISPIESDTAADPASASSSKASSKRRRRYRVTFGTEMCVELSLTEKSLNDFQRACVEDLIFEPNELMQIVVDSTGRTPNRSTRAKVRSLAVLSAQDYQSKLKGTDRLITVINVLISSMKRWEFVMPLVLKYRRKLQSRESTKHWASWVLSNPRACKTESERSQFFNACLQTLGEFANSKGEDATSIAMREGKADWVRSCLAYRKHQQSQSTLEEEKAKAAIRWSAQSRRFAQEYLIRRQGKKGEQCLEVLSDAVVDFIKEEGDIGAVDALGLAWHSSDQHRQAVLQRLLIKAKSTLNYGTLHNDKAGWQWFKELVLKHPIWLSDDIMTEDEKSVVDSSYSTTTTTTSRVSVVGTVQSTRRILFDRLVDHVEKQNKEKISLEIESGIRAMIKGSEKDWSQVCEYIPAEFIEQTRHDLIPGGPVSKQTESHLQMISLSSGLEFNAAKHYDTKVFMFEALSNAHLLQPTFIKKMRSALGQYGKFQAAPVKSPKRIEPKSEEYAANGEEWPHTACVIDLVRCSVTVNTLKELLIAVKGFEMFCALDDGLNIVRFKNGFAKYKPSDSSSLPLTSSSLVVPKHYCDMKFNVAVSDLDSYSSRRIAVIGEVQFLFDCVLDTKKKMHELYEVSRSLPLYRGTKHRMETDQSFQSRFKLTGGVQMHMATLISEFPHLFTLDNIDLGLIVRRAHGYNDLFSNDLVKALVKWSNPTKELRKDLIAALAVATSELGSPEEYANEKKDNPWPGLVKFLCKIQLTMDNDFNLAEFWQLFLDELDGDTASDIEEKKSDDSDDTVVVSDQKASKKKDLCHYCALLFALPLKVKKTLSFHSCFDTDQWSFLGKGMENGYIPKLSMKQFVEYFDEFDVSKDEQNLKYLSNALCVLYSEHHCDEYFKESEQDRYQIYREFKTRFDDDDDDGTLKLKKQKKDLLFNFDDWNSVDPRWIGLIKRMIDSNEQWLNLLRKYPQSVLVDAWVKQATIVEHWSCDQYFRVFGGALPKDLKSNPHIAAKIWSPFQDGTQTRSLLMMMSDGGAVSSDVPLSCVHSEKTSNEYLTGSFTLSDCLKLIPNDMTPEMEEYYWMNDHWSQGYPGYILLMNMPSDYLNRLLMSIIINNMESKKKLLSSQLFFEELIDSFKNGWIDILGICQVFEKMNKETKQYMSKVTMNKNVMLQMIYINQYSKYSSNVIKSDDTKLNYLKQCWKKQETFESLIKTFLIGDTLSDAPLISEYESLMKSAQWKSDLRIRVMKLLNGEDVDCSSALASPDASLESSATVTTAKSPISPRGLASPLDSSSPKSSPRGSTAPFETTGLFSISKAAHSTLDS